MAKPEIIHLREIEKDLAERSATVGNQSPSDRTDVRSRVSQWPELFAAVGGEKMVGNGKDGDPGGDPFIGISHWPELFNGIGAAKMPGGVKENR
jgi:hypothetical protein